MERLDPYIVQTGSQGTVRNQIMGVNFRPVMHAQPGPIKLASGIAWAFFMSGQSFLSAHAQLGPILQGARASLAWARALRKLWPFTKETHV